LLDLWNHLWWFLCRTTRGGMWLHVLALANRFAGVNLVDEAVRSYLAGLARVYTCLLVNATDYHYLGLVDVKPRMVVLACLLGWCVGFVAER